MVHRGGGEIMSQRVPQYIAFDIGIGQDLILTACLRGNRMDRYPASWCIKAMPPDLGEIEARSRSKAEQCAVYLHHQAEVQS